VKDYKIVKGHDSVDKACGSKRQQRGAVVRLATGSLNLGPDHVPARCEDTFFLLSRSDY
jgi:hypothetical protein